MFSGFGSFELVVSCFVKLKKCNEQNYGCNKDADAKEGQRVVTRVKSI